MQEIGLHGYEEVDTKSKKEKGSKEDNFGVMAKIKNTFSKMHLRLHCNMLG
jgi:hypothetical protein